MAERSAEAPASTDAANLKLQGQSLALTPVASSGWFGDVFISSKISSQLSPNCNREPHEIHGKQSASSARTPQPPNSQEVTEETEDRLHLRSLRCLLFKM